MQIWMLSGFIVIKILPIWISQKGKKMKIEIQREKVGSGVNQVCNVIQECAREYVKYAQKAGTTVKTILEGLCAWTS